MQSPFALKGNTGFRHSCIFFRCPFSLWLIQMWVVEAAISTLYVFTPFYPWCHFSVATFLALDKVRHHSSSGPRVVLCHPSPDWTEWVSYNTISFQTEFQCGKLRTEQLSILSLKIERMPPCFQQAFTGAWQQYQNDFAWFLSPEN